MCAASPSCLRLLMHLVRLAASRAASTAGKISPIRMPMIAITTKSSIMVNARRAVFSEFASTAALLFLNDSITAEPLLQLGHLPSLHCFVPASREKQPAVVAESDGADEADVAAEAMDYFSIAGVPNF